MRTHSCGVFGAGAGVVGELLGVGVGLELGLGSGLGEGVGVADAESVGVGVGVEVSVGVGVEVSAGATVELSVGVGVEVSVGVGVEVSDGAGVAVSDGVGVAVSDGASAAETESNLPPLRLLLACPLVLLITAAVSTAVLGGEAQAALVPAMGTMIASAVVAWPNTLKPRMPNPAIAPSADRLTIRALTRTTSL